MFKYKWKDEKGVSPVIGTILMVAITVVLAGVLVVYIQKYMSVQNNTNITGSANAQSFTNPYDGVKTKNGGGWYVELTVLSGGKPSWSEVTVQLTKNNMPVGRMAGIKPSTATYSNANGTAIKWYALGAGGQMAYCPNNCANKANIVQAMGPGDFETLENAYLVVIDSNANGLLDVGDQVYVYENYQGGMNQLVGGLGWSLEFRLSATSICSASLD